MNDKVQDLQNILFYTKSIKLAFRNLVKLNGVAISS